MFSVSDISRGDNMGWCPWSYHRKVSLYLSVTFTFFSHLLSHIVSVSVIQAFSHTFSTFLLTYSHIVWEVAVQNKEWENELRSLKSLFLQNWQHDISITGLYWFIVTSKITFNYLVQQIHFERNVNLHEVFYKLFRKMFLMNASAKLRNLHPEYMYLQNVQWQQISLSDHRNDSMIYVFMVSSLKVVSNQTFTIEV